MKMIKYVFTDILLLITVLICIAVIYVPPVLVMYYVCSNKLLILLMAGIEILSALGIVFTFIVRIFKDMIICFSSKIGSRKA